MAANVSARYPRAGDRGQTSLPGGVRLSKASLAVAAGGEVDELVSHVGLLRAQVRAAFAAAGEPAGLLRAIQADLYAVAAILAGPAAASVRRAAQFGRRRRVRFLEAQLRRCAGELPPGKHFVLPGSSVLEAQAHVARTVCRRCERTLVRCAAVRPLPPVVLAYVNRLSAFLFVYARWLAARQQAVEETWAPLAPSSGRGGRRGAIRDRRR